MSDLQPFLLVGATLLTGLVVIALIFLTTENRLLREQNKVLREQRDFWMTFDGGKKPDE